VRVGHTYRARVRHKDATGRWSYWSEPVQFVAGLPSTQVYDNSVVISEVNYNPSPITPAETTAGVSDKDQFEFIELKNITNLAVDLTDVRFTKGVDVNFPANFSLPANGFALVVRNPAAFQVRYGAGLNSLIAGTFTGALDNGGEQLKLSYGTGTALRDFVYDDTLPWPSEPDGAGPTMVLKAPLSNPNHGDGSNWRASYLNLGSPGADDVFNYAAWATQNANTANAPNADPDHDGIDNRLEFALGGDPNVENSIDGGNGILPTGEVATNPAGAPAGDYLTITFTRPADLAGVTYTPQFSTDLTAWQGGMVSVSSVDNGNGTITEVWRTPASVSATTRYFIHVKVTLQ
jgi:hypothetical protein